jgi:hypothetical protein
MIGRGIEGEGEGEMQRVAVLCRLYDLYHLYS